MTQTTRARAFAALHRPGHPVVLFNIWDAGSARAVAAAGAAALATGSASVAAAQGYADGEAIPLGMLFDIVARIVAVSDLPLTVDFEAGFAATPDGVAANAARLVALGAVGANIEDQLIGRGGIRAVADQVARLRAVRQGAGPDFFVNARTDLFLQAPAADHAGFLPAALERAAAYAEAGASGFFVPGLTDPALIAAVSAGTGLPVNAMRSPASPPPAELARAGVARISYGPFPHRAAMAALTEAARAAIGG